MPETYYAYGLSIRANRTIPGLSWSNTPRAIDLEVQLGLDPPWLAQALQNPVEQHYVNPELGECGRPILTVSKLFHGNYFLFQYADQTQFVIDRRGTMIWGSWPETLTLEDTATYLLGPVLGFVLQLRGAISLHASAFIIENQAIALVGPAGAGKSTAAAAFAELGYEVISDDVVTLIDQRDNFYVQPAYPRIRLWPESVEALYGKPDALPPLTPNWDKRYLSLERENISFARDPFPLAAIYVLGPRRDEATPLIESMTRKESLISLISNTYVSYLMDTKTRAYEFELLSRLLANVHLRRAISHSDPSHIAKLCRVVIEDFQLSAAAAVTA